MHPVSDSSRALTLLGAGLAALSAALLVAGAWSSSWWSDGRDGTAFSAGLRFVEMCGNGECRDAPLASVGGAGWMRLGIGAFSAAMVGAALLLASAGRSLVAKAGRSALPGAAAIACVGAAILGVIFVTTAPYEVKGLALGGAVVAHFVGAALGAGTAAALLSARRGGEASAR